MPDLGPIPIGPIPVGPIPTRPFPIFLGPTITAITPSGVSAGGSDFTLSVSGGGYVSGSTVNWNEQSRPTTFVSATQLTAAISAGDIASPGSATVGISNPDQRSSVTVTFAIIPDINTIMTALNQITEPIETLQQQLPQVQPGLIAALAELKTYLTNQSSQISSLQSQLGEASQTNSDLVTTNAALTAQTAQQQATITQLQGQVTTAPNTTAAPLDIAQSFKNVVDQIHQVAANGTGVQTTLTNFNVQLKALVTVQQPAVPVGSPSGTAAPPPEAVLVFPDPTALPDANTLSTVSFTFGAIPNLKAASTAPGPVPAVVSSALSPAPSVVVTPASEEPIKTKSTPQDAVTEKAVVSSETKPRKPRSKPRND